MAVSSAKRASGSQASDRGNKMKRCTGSKAKMSSIHAGGAPVGSGGGSSLHSAHTTSEQSSETSDECSGSGVSDSEMCAAPILPGWSASQSKIEGFMLSGEADDNRTVQLSQVSE